MNKKPLVTTAVFPVAGLGVRFLPATYAIPKEMFPIVDRPLIQYAVDEVVEAGIDRLIFITNHNKRCIEDYFDTNLELEQRLAEKGNKRALNIIRNILDKRVEVISIRQSDPKGLGDAVLCAERVVGDVPFCVILPDDLIELHRVNCVKEMLSIHLQTLGSVLSVEPVPKDQTDRYGIVSLANQKSMQSRVCALTEKPRPDEAESNLAIIGRYVLTPRIFHWLKETRPGVGGEIQLTDAIARLLDEEKVKVFPVPEGARHDCGTKEGFLRATLSFSMGKVDLQNSKPASELTSKI